MGQTIAEKMLGHAGGVPDVRAGEIVNARISYLMTNDAVGELTVEALEKLGRKPWDPSRVTVILDHYIPASSENAARVHKLLRDFARTSGVHLFDPLVLKDANDR